MLVLRNFMKHRILVSNIGYARDIDGALLTHFIRSHRHFYTTYYTQKTSLDTYLEIVKKLKPDICCMIEIDSGSFTSGGFNQFEYLIDSVYPFRDISSKYAIGGKLSNFFMTQGKSNGFMANREYEFERLYLSIGSKRLVYRIVLEKGLVLFFTHLSLKKIVRRQQMKELRIIADKENCDVIIAGDFNILAGIDEIDVFTGDGCYQLLNNPEEGTFSLFGKHYLLDLCIVSKSIVTQTSLQIIDQPFSDHDGLFIMVEKS